MLLQIDTQDIKDRQTVIDYFTKVLGYTFLEAGPFIQQLLGHDSYITSINAFPYLGIDTDDRHVGFNMSYKEGWKDITVDEAMQYED